MTFPDNLIVGDFCLYHTPKFTNDIIDIKTASLVDHIECYIGNGLSLASRNGIGVNVYDFRLEGLVVVRRPTLVFNRQLVMDWFETIRGAPYGWGDIIAQANIVTSLPGYDCSHFCACLADKGLLGLFADDFPRNKITPRDFLLPINLGTFYSSVAINNQ